ncbi:MAG: Mannose-6-phosphate isomerase [Promethearchaeota archaeon]|nr:MAG: Mannose-6-phosphate isomerase [Candidatus Lokiarchaeota archaeon]
MFTETLSPDRGTLLRKNCSQNLKIAITPSSQLSELMMIKGDTFISKNISEHDLSLKAGDPYMIINKGKMKLEISYSENIDDHKVIYNPYKYEHAKKEKINPADFKKSHEVPEGYIDILPKWYSIKFTYPDYNLIFIKPEMGISFQVHDQRKEYWEVLDGKPIILNGHNVHYYVESGTQFEIPINSFHTVINPNKNQGDYILLKENWVGNFNEGDITRVFNPNHYH